MSLEQASPESTQPGWAAIFWIFFKIGCISWGGYMALISVVRAEVVERRNLLEDERLMEGVALAMLLPGPVAVNVVAYVGNLLRGRAGAALAVLAVVLPSFAVMLGFALFYSHYSDMDLARAILAAILPAITAIILNAALNMRAKALSGPLDWLLAALAAACLLGFDGIYVVVAVLCAAALIGILRGRGAARQDSAAPLPHHGMGAVSSVAFLAFFLICIAAFLTLPNRSGEALELQLFSAFSGMSLLLFGGGYIFIPMIEEVVVTGLHWLSADEFAASIAMGQITPGPILISATFIGFQVAGLTGAVIATVAIFAPPAMLIILAASHLERLRQFPAFEAAQRGLRVAIFGMIIAAAYSLLAPQVLAAPPKDQMIQLGICAAALVLLRVVKLDGIWVLLMAGALGALLA